MFGTYREVFAVSGAKGFSAAGFIGRMPMSMVGLGIVLLVSTTTGRYGVAGAVAATYAFVAALIGPQIARMVDRLGQARVTLPALACYVVGLAGLMLAVQLRAPDAALFTCAALAGGASPNVGSMVRARWSVLYSGTPRLHTAYSFESFLDEIVFVTGPVLVTVLATQVWKLAGLGVALVLALAGTLAFVLQRRTEPPPTPADRHGGRSAIRVPGVAVLLSTFVAAGSMFGSVDVATVALASAEGHRSLAGLPLATIAAGSALSAAAYGVRSWRSSPRRRFTVAVLLLALAALPLLAVASFGGVWALAFLIGLSVSPTLISGNTLVERLVAPGQLTEGLVWINTGILLGVTAGSSISGWIADAYGPHSAFATTAIAGGFGALSVLCGQRWLRPADLPRRAQDPDAQVIA